MGYKPSPQPSPRGRGSKETEEEKKYQEDKNKDKSCSPLPEGEGLGVRADITRLAGRNRQISKVLLERARELRKQQTPAEEILWECLRDRRLLNTKFRRQHNIGRYITDFYCYE